MHFKNALTMPAFGKGLPSTKGEVLFFFSNVLVAGQRVYNTHKKTHYIDHHKIIKLAGKSISLYISIVSQVALNKIQEPHSE